MDTKILFIADFIDQSLFFGRFPEISIQIGKIFPNITQYMEQK